MYAICLPHKNRSYFWARSSSTLTLFRKWTCLSRSLFQCRRNHRIQHIVVGEISSPCNRLRCQRFVNWFCNLNFFDPEHCEMRICWFWTYFSFEVHVPALKCHRVRKFSQMQFRNGKSRDYQSYHCETKFHQYDITIHLHFGSVVQVSTNVAVLVSFHSPASLYFLQYLVPIFEKTMPNSLHHWIE